MTSDSENENMKFTIIFKFTDFPSDTGVNRACDEVTRRRSNELGKF